VQIEFTYAGIREALTRFAPMMRKVLDQLHSPTSQRPFDDARQMIDLTQDMLDRLDYMNTRFDELRQLSKEGFTLIRDTKSTLPHYPREHLTALQVTITRHLCLAEDTLASAPEAWSTIDSIVDTADIAIQCLTDTLKERSESRLDERIGTLGSLVGQFQVIGERLSDFAKRYTAHTQPTRIQGLRDQLKAFSREATQNLALLSVERDALRLRPIQPPLPPRPNSQFIHTRYEGIRIGEPRLSPTGEQTDLVDIRSPITQKIIATYHQKSPGVWVERVQTSTEPAATLDIQAAVREGQALLDTLPEFLRQADVRANQEERTTLGIENLYHQQALRLERASEAIDQALTQGNITENVNQPASAVNKALDTAIAQLYRRSREHLLRLHKTQAPTIENVEWLLNHNEIKIKKTITRRKLKSPRPDYLDEYSIVERSSGKPLWYAHFHYSASWTPAKYYIAARLKTPAEQLKGLAADTTVGLSEAQRIDYYLSEISLKQADRLFFEKKEA